MTELKDTPVRLDDHKGLIGDTIQTTDRTLEQIAKIFEDQEALKSMDLSQKAYEVTIYQPVPEGTEGGLFYGYTTIYPGKVGAEYFMTKGHFHAIMDRSEFYWGIRGEGILLYMDEHRRSWAEIMKPGSLHYIPGRVAHRTINTGNEPLFFGACWPSDAGHDYGTILEKGFSARVKSVDGMPKVVEN
jgi:glucose-6-phosphate isomerase